MGAIRIGREAVMKFDAESEARLKPVSTSKPPPPEKVRKAEPKKEKPQPKVSEGKKR
jgi:hypothetical protein